MNNYVIQTNCSHLKSFEQYLLWMLLMPMSQTRNLSVPPPSAVNPYLLFITRVRNEWDEMSNEECTDFITHLRSQQIDSIFTQFSEGDRLFGFNGGTVPYVILFYKAKLLDPYSMLIDPLYNTFLKLNPDVLGLDIFDHNKFKASCIKYHEFYRANIKLEALLKQDLSDRAKFANACIRLCKLGMLKTLQQGNKIYFVLDGLSMEDIITKADKRTSNTPIGYYTNKEVRYCYRLAKAAPNLSKGISFWKDDKRVPAPWVSNPEQWDRYKPKMLNIHEEVPEQSPNTTP